MHAGAFEWIRMWAGGRKWCRVLEVGALNINGSARAAVLADAYHGIDRVSGPGVDEIADAHGYTPAEAPDLVVCAEVLEHDPDPAGLVSRLWSWIQAEGGVLILTAASPGRAPHSAIDGGPVRPGEHYAGIAHADLRAWCDALPEAVALVDECRPLGDVYAMVRRVRA